MFTQTLARESQVVSSRSVVVCFFLHWLNQWGKKLVSLGSLSRWEEISPGFQLVRASEENGCHYLKLLPRGWPAGATLELELSLCLDKQEREDWRLEAFTLFFSGHNPVMVEARQEARGLKVTLLIPSRRLPKGHWWVEMPPDLNNP